MYYVIRVLIFISIFNYRVNQEELIEQKLIFSAI